MRVVKPAHHSEVRTRSCISDATSCGRAHLQQQLELFFRSTLLPRIPAAGGLLGTFCGGDFLLLSPLCRRGKALQLQTRICCNQCLQTMSQSNNSSSQHELPMQCRCTVLKIVLD